MNIERIIRAWKEVEYRESLSEEEQASLLPNPAAFIDLADTELDTVVGGTTIIIICTSIPSFCERSSLCGTCAVFTDGCC